MLKTMSGCASESFCGKNSSASRRSTLPKRLSACSTASIVDGSSHSAYASDASLASGFSLYASPIRILDQNTKSIWSAQERNGEKHASRNCDFVRRFCSTLFLDVFTRRLSDFVINDAR